jgi:Putative zinc-finger
MLSHEEAVERDCAAQYVLGDLPEAERDPFEEHLFDCSACSDKVRTGYLLVRGAEITWKRPIAAAVQPAPTPIKGRRRSWVIAALPYVATLALSLAAGFQNVALQRARSPQAVLAFNVPPQTKGDARQIRLPRTGQFVELDLDVFAPQPQYHWEIRPASDTRAVMAGKAQVPGEDSVLRLLLPARTLRPGRYEAVLAGPAGRPEVYPFEVVAGSPTY